MATAVVLTILASSALHAYNWTGWGYVQQIYVRHDGETTFFFSKHHHCPGVTATNYFKIPASHAAHDRMFALLQSAQVNGIQIKVDFTCKSATTAAIVGTIKTEGLNS